MNPTITELLKEALSQKQYMLKDAKAQLEYHEHLRETHAKKVEEERAAIKIFEHYIAEIENILASEVVHGS